MNAKLMRAILIVLSLIMAISLMACDGEEVKDTNAPETKAPETSNSSTDTLPAEESEETTEPATEAPETEAPATEAPDTQAPETDGAETDAPACAHQISEYAYASDNDGSTKTANLSGVCSKCGETVTKSASFFTAIESVYGDNGDNVIIFQATADGNPAPIMGGVVYEYDNTKPYYPANGFSSIPADFPNFGGMLGISGWGGYAGVSANDGAAFRAVDAEGNVIVDWTPVTAILANAGLALSTPAEDAVNAMLAGAYTDAKVQGIRFNHIINTLDYPELAGKTVDVTFAFTTALGVDGDVYVPYFTIKSVSVPAAQ